MAKVLVVDDENSIRKTLTEYLTEKGYEVQEAEDAEKAFKILKTDSIDVVVTDIIMPRVSGIALLEAIHESAPDVQVILMTGEPTVETASQALRAGAFDYLSKPFSLKKIDHVIANAARIKSVDDERKRLEKENTDYRLHLEELVEKRTQEVLQSRENLIKTQKQLLTILQTTPHGLCILDRNWNFEYLNSAMTRILSPTQREAPELLGASFSTLFFSPDDYQQFRREVLDRLEDESMVSVERRLRTLEGIELWALIAIGLNRKDNRSGGYVVTITDTTDRKEMELALEHRATHDELTNLPNRAMFSTRISRSILRKTEEPEFAFAIIYLDLDGFKNINDSFGHNVGDKLLKQFARRLRDCLRPDDVVARLGGDEFAVLVDNFDEDSTPYLISERIHRKLYPPFFIENHEFYCSTSIGIVHSSAINLSAQDYLRNADIAMYRAKETGRGNTRIFDEEMHRTVQRVVELETDLRKAVERHQFILAYQPVVSLTNGQLVGFEALIRWDHPRKGRISPGEFIPKAEDTGLIVPIGRWVMEEAAWQISDWNRRYFSEKVPIEISVNISSKQIQQSDFFQEMQSLLSRQALQGAPINLEITESTIMEDTSATGEFIENASKMGMRIHIDDFGTGYSSLSYLQKFKVHCVKIDRSFVSKLPDSEEGLELIRAIIQLAHNLNLEVVAEGIETRAQKEILQELGCDRAQGYYFSPPLNPEALEDILDWHQQKTPSDRIAHSICFPQSN